MKKLMRVPAAVFAAATVLAACGGGGGGSTSRAPSPGPAATTTSFDRNQAVAYDAGQPSGVRSVGSLEPTNTDPSGRVAFVGGANPIPMMQAVERVSGCTQQSCYPRSLHTVHDGVEVGHVRFRDGVSASELLRYLRADARDYSERVVRRWSSPPTVRMVAGSTDQDILDTFQAVRLVNSALPAEWQLRFDHDTPAARDHQLTPGVIEVGFVRREQWPNGSCGSSTRAIGCAWTQSSAGRVTAAGVAVDDIRVTGERKRIGVLLHELLHALGRGHVDPNVIPNTIMHASGDEGQSEHLILSDLDVAALYAVYDRLQPGESGDLDFNDLGPWSDVSTHVVGRIGYIPGRFEAVLFGAVWQNGNVRPWAMALNPSELPQQVSGSASWAGRLLGMTPRAETVAGAADMTVSLATLRGALDFTGLEYWAAHAGPGARGTGTQWRDGDLNYRIAVSGALFYDTGGDAGKVTGAFYGSNQQKVGGTLRRTDLAAGFGAQRR
ncbi:MAG: hypothetical protein OXM58_15700 [Rhodospirillaceae bacterium]|nr:hypothetical protein [Rhodospirillaceae bacterium]MDE0619720.1 hypothetical protein [Rhodospirillaceae bacterium]